MSQITNEVRALIKEYNPERYDIIMRHWEELEESMFKWSTCIGSYIEREPEINPLKQLPRQLRPCLRSFHNEKICPYAYGQEPCRF